jgi:hypothetical protein
LLLIFFLSDHPSVLHIVAFINFPLPEVSNVGLFSVLGIL